MHIATQPDHMLPVTLPLALIADSLRERRAWAQTYSAGQGDAAANERGFISAEARADALLETYSAKLAEAATKEGDYGTWG
mgnify:CR=1 FL=1